MPADLVRRVRNRWPSALLSPQRFDSRPPISRRKRPCKPSAPIPASVRHHRTPRRLSVYPANIEHAATIGKPSATIERRAVCQSIRRPFDRVPRPASGLSAIRRTSNTPPPSEAATVRPWRTSNTPRRRIPASRPPVYPATVCRVPLPACQRFDRAASPPPSPETRRKRPPLRPPAPDGFAPVPPCRALASLFQAV